MDTTIDPLMLPETVDALSVGRLVVDHQYSFHWPAGEDAYLVDRSGKRTVCDTKGYVKNSTKTDHGEENDLICLPCEDAPDGEKSES